MDGLRDLLANARACSFCVGYLNLRGWDQIADVIERLKGDDKLPACRILVGMHRAPEEEMKLLYQAISQPSTLDGPTRAMLLKRFVESFKRQIEFGVPSDHAEDALRRLAKQLKEGKVIVKAFLRYPLHAKLYLVHRYDSAAPLVGFVGSSNLTLAGLSQQGELNVDVLDQDAAQKLLAWFDQRWNDPTTIDITKDLVEVIENSWAREERVPPYLVYLKMAYHLCEEARRGEQDVKMPKSFEGVLLDFQKAAVSLAVHMLYQRRGVLLGDVVGLGKTLMATAIARILQEDADVKTLVVCPPNLVSMWKDYFDRYEIEGRVLSLGKVDTELPKLSRHRLLIIDESHNLRNRESKRYRALCEYIDLNDPYVILLTATPYNKHFADLANQLRLFVDEDADLKVRPERFFQDWVAKGKRDADFIATYRALPTSLRAFEQSPYPEDWRDLMRRFMIRRTRKFIMEHYARIDEENRRYLEIDGRPHYIPERQPKSVHFPTDSPNLYSQLGKVVEEIEKLRLPRYGLGNYLLENASDKANDQEKRLLDNLTRAGRRLIGFSRTNLFKRLESSGYTFLISVERHILRNWVALYALENGLELPIGPQDAALLDTAIRDTDSETSPEAEDEANEPPLEATQDLSSSQKQDYAERAKSLYEQYRTYEKRFRWLSSRFFKMDELKRDLEEDIEALRRILDIAGDWNPDQDPKLAALYDLLMNQHPNDKVLVFTQFADTALYLGKQLGRYGVDKLEVVTSDSEDPYAIARRFSPLSNNVAEDSLDELRVLITTDVLSEGQNLQDAHIVVNYDLPWAIIRLIQRAGRVDRIGQTSKTILVYSFFPADGVESIIHLRQRLIERLRINQETIGTDELFFEEEVSSGKGAPSFQQLRDLYTEKAGVLDDDSADEDIDLASLALREWKKASPKDREKALKLPNLVYATRAVRPNERAPEISLPSVITYLRFPDGSDALVQVDAEGQLVSRSASFIFRQAACAPNEPAQARHPKHHELVTKCMEIIHKEQTMLGGQLGTLRSLRRKLYERLRRYREQFEKEPLNSSIASQLEALERVMDLIYRYPLKAAAEEAIRRQLKLGIDDKSLLQILTDYADSDRLCAVPQDPDEPLPEPQIICSLGLISSVAKT